MYNNTDEQSIYYIRKNLMTYNLKHLEVRDRNKYLRDIDLNAEKLILKKY